MVDVEGAAASARRKPRRLWRRAAVGALLGGLAAAIIILACNPFAPGEGAEAAYIWTILITLPSGPVIEAILQLVAEPGVADVAFLIAAPILNGAALGLLWGLSKRRPER